MKDRSLCLLLILQLFFLVACDNNNFIKRNETEWIGKKISFPLKLEYFSSNTDTTIKSCLPTYRILLYADSVGSLERKLNLLAWKRYICEIDSIVPEIVDFLFIIESKEKEKLKYILKNSKFEYPIFMDLKGELSLLNKFPTDMNMQCFLLDSINRIISVGNPILNPQIGELYKRIILSSHKTEHSNTTVAIKEQNLEINNLVANKGNLCEFTLKNVGHDLLYITKIETTCDCTHTLWSRKAVLPGEEVVIKVEIFPDNSGYLYQSLFVYCNVESKIIELNISGVVK